MFRIITISILIVVTAASPRVGPKVAILSERIIGGEPADIKDLPYQLALEYKGVCYCGAAIISATKALTAAHCTNPVPEPEYLAVRANSSIRSEGGQVVKVKSFCQHPGFVVETGNNDVSVLILASPLIMGIGVQRIPLIGLNEQIGAGVLGTVSGWGRLQPEGNVSQQLMKVQLPRVSEEECKEIYGSDLTENMVCFGFIEGGRDSCDMDSGGPMVVDGKQVGIISWGRECAEPGFPGVYTDLSVANIRDHIDSC